jgi:AhpD family alkylhydroperoxidase
VEPRMKNPAMIIPDAGQAIGALVAALRGAGLPEATENLVHLRVSQINGCSACADGGARTAQKAGESAERLFAVLPWRSPRRSLV